MLDRGNGCKISTDCIAKEVDFTAGRMAQQPAPFGQLEDPPCGPRNHGSRGPFRGLPCGPPVAQQVGHFLT